MSVRMHSRLATAAAALTELVAVVSLAWLFLG